MEFLFLNVLTYLILKFILSDINIDTLAFCD